MLAERRTRARVEKVYRHLARFELGELEREVDALLERLAHAEDAAATKLHAGFSRELCGRDAVVVGVRRAYLRKELAARFEVVVVATDPRGCEPFCLFGLQQPERARDLEPGLAVHHVDGVDDLAQQPFLRTAHGDDDAELRRARGARGACRLEDLVEVEEGEHIDAGVETHRLRAERAVFRARARLGVDQAFELDLGPAPREPYLVREPDERRQVVEGEVRDRERFVASEAATFLEQGAFGGDERRCGHRGIVT